MFVELVWTQQVTDPCAIFQILLHGWWQQKKKWKKCIRTKTTIMRMPLQFVQFVVSSPVWSEHNGLLHSSFRATCVFCLKGCQRQLHIGGAEGLGPRVDVLICFDTQMVQSPVRCSRSFGWCTPPWRTINSGWNRSLLSVQSTDISCHRPHEPGTKSPCVPARRRCRTVPHLEQRIGTQRSQRYAHGFGLMR